MNKTIVISSKANLSFDNGWMLINIEKEYLDDVSTIVINSLQINITSYLINEIIKRKINLVFTDECKLPSSILTRLYDNSFAPKRLQSQISYSKKKKDYVWMIIVKNKIKMQSMLIKRLFDIEIFNDDITKVVTGDKNNIEAFVARKYFYKLFGNNFNRRESNEINAALNYGYSIIASEISRVIVGYGYSTMLGIHHDSSTNFFNLSYDIIEPFRPLIDEIVYNNKGKTFDKNYKKELINALNKEVIYKKKRYLVINCIETYILDMFRYFEKNEQIGEIEFDN